MFIDHYGTKRMARQETYVPLVHIKDTNTQGTVYVCFSGTDPRAIQRTVTANNIETTTWAYGDWADRATLEYIPVNDVVHI